MIPTCMLGAARCAGDDFAVVVTRCSKSLILSVTQI
jgi:hypothetical protein